MHQAELQWVEPQHKLHDYIGPVVKIFVEHMYDKLHQHNPHVGGAWHYFFDFLEAAYRQHHRHHKGRLTRAYDCQRRCWFDIADTLSVRSTSAWSSSTKQLRQHAIAATSPTRMDMWPLRRDTTSMTVSTTFDVEQLHRQIIIIIVITLTRRARFWTVVCGKLFRSWQNWDCHLQPRPLTSAKRPGMHPVTSARFLFHDYNFVQKMRIFLRL
jgi:hypothetical protein